MVAIRRKSIHDIAPQGITGNMTATINGSFNGKKTFDIVSVDFQEDLVALDVWENVNDPRWYRAESIKSTQKKRICKICGDELSELDDLVCGYHSME